MESLTEGQLQQLVERVSTDFFQRPFTHRAYFNPRLRTTGGRYVLGTHNIEINPKHYHLFGIEELVGIIKHELCHYHLHLAGRGYKHKDSDFKQLLKQVGGSRYCQSVAPRKRQEYRYELVCQDCGMRYLRRRHVNTRKYVCGKCRGRLHLRELEETYDGKTAR
ncbi:MULTISPECIES: SprT family protein [Aneurinibacillus]|jgi:SprT-like protein|uniref:Protein SprT-like n=1 Tax=Aneurinibacillus danicus TaxID=267746 RepID=A0A511VCV5_9BACL|nr:MULTISPECIES: SprT family protein [Aneurinibacillus]GEN36241.1 protein SprT [Aneurinibacillus danicus]